jgi:hypothetical protein
MAAVPAVARSNFPWLATFPPDEPATRTDASAKLQKSLATLFPDLLVHGTRNWLLNVTTALTKVSGQAHRYFARLSYALAFERMVRSFMQLTATVSAFPMDFGAANGWSGLFLPGPQTAAPWGYSAPKQLQPPATHFAGMSLPAMYPPAMSLLAGPASPSQSWADYSAMFIVPLALLAAAPMTENWWKFGF